MYAIEFQTKALNGIIEIPEEYKDKLRGEMRVTVHIEEDETAGGI